MPTLKEKIETLFKTRYADAQVQEVGVGLGSSFYILVTKAFEGQEETARQDQVWAVLRENLSFDEVKGLGFILTMTPEEEKAYAE
jgi:acid stress-induced BolA-like protein IbaG/YrbA